MITGNEGSMFEIGIAYWEPGMWEIQDWLLSLQIDAWIATEFMKTAMGDPLHATGNLWGELDWHALYHMQVGSLEALSLEYMAEGLVAGGNIGHRFIHALQGTEVEYHYPGGTQANLV